MDVYDRANAKSLYGNLVSTMLKNDGFVLYFKLTLIKGIDIQKIVD